MKVEDQMSKVKITNRNSKLFQRVYEVVKRIPSGKVATYGQIAEILGTKDARKIGFALHANRDENTPCHRVVNKDGRLAPNFAFSAKSDKSHILGGPARNRTLRRIRTELKSREGRLGGDGAAEQRKRLLDEGVKFKDEMHVDLDKCLWKRR